MSATRSCTRRSGRTTELFDLQNDPKETTPIKSGPELDEWSAKLTAFIGTLKEQKPTGCASGCMKGW